MPPKKILVLYKKSAYKIYFLEKKSSLFQKENSLTPLEIHDFKRAHEKHYQSLAMVKKILDQYTIQYHVRARGSKIDFSRYELVITVGGDGTFLEAARGLKDQFILGVNSDPQSSVGRFCSCGSEDFEKVLNKFLTGKAKIKNFQRIHLDLRFGGKHYETQVLNDILVCHQNPAAMSRYSLSVNGVQEEQRSSGIWISTAAGSSGAIHSAGGKLIAQEAAEIQYKPRELYRWPKRKYELTGGVLLLKQPIVITSLMRNGVVFVDGAHLKFPFHFGSKAVMTHSPRPLKVIAG
ncbi:MAG TPA: NAD(+)/NADH kinase [Candidatus Omnitrophota bacterium]|nr:NAD(+)/NADH kinase [Candidatus Omnitrophota bacterium]